MCNSSRVCSALLPLGCTAQVTAVIVARLLDKGWARNWDSVRLKWHVATHCLILCREQWNTGVVTIEEKKGWHFIRVMRMYGSANIMKDWAMRLSSISELDLEPSSVFCIYDAVFSCSHGNHKISIYAAAVCARSKMSCTLFTTSKMFIGLFLYFILEWLLCDDL